MLLNSLEASGNYTLWNAANNSGLQALSDLVVTSLFRLATPNQSVPSWVYSLPEPERDRKIAMVKKYGSPNVFSEFNPHVTVAYHPEDNMTQIVRAKFTPSPNAHWVAETVAISHVGPFGTVLRNGQIAKVNLPRGSTMAANGILPKFDDNSWDFFLLVREWPGTIATQPMPSYLNSFTVHGLWPQRQDNTWPSFCNNSYPYRYSEIAGILHQLDVAWFDSLHGHVNGSDFWSHEWEKHGTCAMVGDRSMIGSELGYFQAAISLHDQITEVAWLAQAGITPADPSQTMYDTDKFLSAMSDQLGQQAMIKCSHKDGNTVINNFGVCIDKSLSVMACPDSLIQQWQQSANCGSQVGYPVIPH